MHCTILGMVKPTLFGGIGGKLREKMSNGYRNCNYHLFSFYFVKYLLNKTKNFIKNTPINRGNMCSISFSYVKLYLSQRKKGVSAISKSVRNQYLEFLAETGMTRYEFSKRSGIPESTLWSLGQKEDYDVRESNIRKIAKGMGVPASDLFNDNENTICLEDRSEVWIIKNYRRLSERQKGRIEGYIKALLDETGRNDFQSE